MIAGLLRHERAAIVGIIALLVGFSWWFLLRGAQMAMMEPPLGAVIMMWWLMMLAMMLPSATPAILLYARVRQTHAGGTRLAQPWVFLAGYLAVWLLFSIVAAAVQRLATDSSMMLVGRTSRGCVLVSAGLYQLCSLKSACLIQCRSPGQFISRHWRPGWIGAVELGVLHGAYCVGCCWLLMGLLFVGGVMNLVWVVGLTTLIAAEKLSSWSILSRISAIVFIVSGLVLILG